MNERYIFDVKNKQIIIERTRDDVAKLDISCLLEELSFFEGMFRNGNFILSNRYQESEKLLYQHFFVTEEKGQYKIQRGKLWDDHHLRFFDFMSDHIIQVTSCKICEKSYYDFSSQEEYANPPKVKIMK